MSEPYTVNMARKVLAAMPAERLATIAPLDFHKWPTRQIVPAKILSELIEGERARRANHDPRMAEEERAVG